MDFTIREGYEFPQHIRTAVDIDGDMAVFKGVIVDNICPKDEYTLTGSAEGMGMYEQSFIEKLHTSNYFQISDERMQELISSGEIVVIA